MTDDNTPNDDTIETDEQHGPTMVGPDEFEETCDNFDVNGFRKHMLEAVGDALDEYVETTDTEGIPDVFFALCLAEIIDEYTSLSAVPTAGLAAGTALETEPIGQFVPDEGEDDRTFQ